MQILSVLKLKLQKKIIQIGNIVKKLSDLFRRCSKINKYIAFIFVLRKLLNDCRFSDTPCTSTSRAVLPPDSFFHCNILSYIFRLNIGFLLFAFFILLISRIIAFFIKAFLYFIAIFISGILSVIAIFILQYYHFSALFAIPIPIFA